MGLLIVSYLSFTDFNKTTPQSNQEALAQFFQLPIYFESNQGQTDSSYGFRLQRRDQTLARYRAHATSDLNSIVA